MDSRSLLAALSDRWKRFHADSSRSDFDSGRMLQIEVTIGLMTDLPVATVRRSLEQHAGS